MIKQENDGQLVQHMEKNKSIWHTKNKFQVHEKSLYLKAKV